MSSIRGKRKGMGKIAFLANKPRILNLMEKGYSPILIFEELRKMGQTLCSYRQFCRYLATLRNEQQSPTLSISSPLASPSSAPAQAASSAQVLPEAGATAALPPAEEAVLPKKRERKRKRDAVVNADFIPTEFPID